MSRLLIVSATRSKIDSETLLKRSITEQGLPYSTKFELSNSQGLPKVYNRYVTEYTARFHEWVVFVHDDVWIDDPCIEEKLDIAHNQLGYDIIGVAGSQNPTIKHPALWHLMSEKQHLRGQAGHFVETSEKINETTPRWITSFGYTPSRVMLLDGVFIAVHLRSAIKAGWRWNEDYDFHHYDLASCIDANTKKLKMGVYPINIYHASHGLKSLDDSTWSRNNARFLKSYGQ